MEKIAKDTAVINQLRKAEWAFQYRLKRVFVKFETHCSLR